MKTGYCENMFICGAVLCLVLTMVGAAESQNGTDSTSDKSQQLSGRAIDEGMEPFYIMTDNFIKLVRPKDNIFDAFDERGIKEIDLYINKLSTQEDHGDDITFWMEYYTGFIVCICVGIIFILATLIWGLVYCCCRCCGHCGARVNEQEGKHAKCKRLTCGFLLFIFAGFILAGTVLLFLTNELVWEQTAPGERNIVTKITYNLDRVEAFRDESVKEFWDVYDDLEDELDDIVRQINDIPQGALDAIDAVTSSEEILEKAERLVESVNKINDSMTKVEFYAKELVSLGTQLSNQLGTLKTDMTATLDGCTYQECDDLQDDVNRLDTVADFTLLYDVTDLVDSVQDILDADLEALVQEANDEYDSIRQDINSEIQADVQNVEDEIERVLADVKVEFEKIQNQVKQYTFNDTKKVLEQDVQPQIEEYGDYRKYGAIGVGCVLLVAVVLFYLGLLLGCCGEPAYEDASSCNRGTGANLLLSGIIWCFLFGWILMIILIVLFLSGGLASSEVCRYTQDLEETIKHPTAKHMIESILNDTNIEVDMKKLVLDCAANKGIYTALELEKIEGLDVDALLDLDQYGFQEEIDKLKMVTVDISDVEILSPDTRTQLENLRDTTLDDIDFESFYTELRKDLTEVDLNELKQSTLDLAIFLQDRGDTTRSDELNDHADTIDNILTGTIAEIEADKTQLGNAVQQLQTEVDSGNPTFSGHVQNLIDAFDSAQEKIQTDGSQIVEQYLLDEANNIYDHADQYLQDTAYRIKNDVARCGSLYDTVTDAVDVYCDDFLDPYNALWFSLGWCLAAFIPAIIIAMVLNIEYRKTEEYERTDKSFDDP